MGRAVDTGAVRALATFPNTVLRALYPPRCAACDRQLQAFDGMCALCLESCEPCGPFCPRCGRPPDLAPPSPCLCTKGPSSLHSCTAGFAYGGQIAVALRRLKFSGRNDVARALSILLRESFANASGGCDQAIAVPLHRTRLGKRGFNQAQRLLVPLAKAQQLAQPRRFLVRRHSTPEQSRLSRKERVANLKGAFQASPAVRGKRILLLDDIRTTGATLEAAAGALRRAGAREIHGFVVAQTEWDR